MLLNLDASKACGPDELSGVVLKECARQLAPSLTALFQLSMSSGQLPKQWKLANIVPVHKKESKAEVQNYRPISLLSVASKVMERCVFDYVYHHVQHLISPQQHGFIRGKSTATQLNDTYHRVGETLDAGGQTDIIFLDLAKAFDSVSHSLLLHKLKSFGLHNKLLDWLASYVTEREQRVIIDGVHSSWLSVDSGVPQGSILGPLLFVLYINDAPSCVLSMAGLFADDTKVYRKITSLDDCAILQRDLDSLLEWCKKWKLIFNAKKCKVMSVTRRRNWCEFTYSLGGTTLERVDSYCDLGVTITNTLTFDKHIKNQVSKANSIVGMIKRATGRLASPTVMITLFRTLVICHFEHCSQVWSPQHKCDIQAIESVQRRFTKHIVSDPDLSYKERLISLGLLPLSYRRELSDLLYFYKCIHHVYDVDLSEVVSPVENTSNLRSASNGPLFRHRRCRTSTFQSSFCNRTVDLWNVLPANIRTCTTLAAFRHCLKRHYRDKLVSYYDPDNTCTLTTICRCAMCL